MSQTRGISFAPFQNRGDHPQGKLEIDRKCKRQVDSLTALVEEYKMMLEKNRSHTQRMAELAQQHQQVVERSVAELQKKLADCSSQIKE